MINLDLLDSFQRVQNLAELHALSMRACREMGFEHFLYALRVNTSLSRPYQFILSGYPPAWRSHYDSSGYMNIDPSVAHCQKRMIPLVWGDKVFNQPQASQLMHDATDFGLASGVSLPTHGLNGEVGMLSLASSMPTHQVGADIVATLGQAQLFACYLQEAARRLVLSKDGLPIKSPTLTAREKECLQWAAEGKTAWEIAQILRIAERTSVFHLNNAVEKVGATNRRQAVVKAITMGLITT